jgi:hypothetical protein
MKKNVLVFPSGTEIGLEINRALSYSTHFELFGANSTNDHAEFVYKNYLHLPFIDSSDFLACLNQIIAAYQIDYIFPAHDSVVLYMAEQQSNIQAEVITSPFATCEVCRSKKKTYHFFSSLITTPKVYANPEDVDTFPVFLKPDVGQGSKGTYKVNNSQELSFFLKKDSSLLILEYLPGKEYTIDCFTDRQGNLRYASGRVRGRISNGISVSSHEVQNQEFKRISQIINEHLNFRGVWFFQLKENKDGDLSLLEIAPRVAGTMSLPRAMGVNLVQLALFDRMNYDIDIVKNSYKLTLDRALHTKYKIDLSYQYVYIDFDDTITFQQNVNPTLLHFLYQTKNEGKQMILITKHEKNIYESLDRLCINPSLFDKIIHLSKNDKKSNFIEHTDAIFIDDSFAERKEVAEIVGIPVFAPDAVEVLLSWKV